MSLDDKGPEEIREIADIMENHCLDSDEAEYVKEIMDDEGLDEDDAIELRDLL